MVTQTERRTATKEAIVSAAIQQYLTAGNIEVSLDTVALEAGVAKATILYHFESRMGLLGAVADRLLEEFLERIGPIEQFDSPLGGIRAYLEQGLEPTASLFTQVSDALTYAGQASITTGLDLLVEALRLGGVTETPVVVAAAMQTMIRQISFGYVDAKGIDRFIMEIAHML
ncbi:MAG TPA: TetR/AcrR family transcriptional regulator [Acidimicrobiales bacterium]|nr:TetR/AcrR family transcriptional regulator [Acidimicrobiales bacterium]